MQYSKFERNRKVVGMIFELMELNMDWVVKDEQMDGIMKFINKGVDYKTLIDLPRYSSELEIHLVNDKKQKTFMHLKRNKVTSEDKDIEKINEDNLLNLQRVMEGSTPDMK